MQQSTNYLQGEEDESKQKRKYNVITADLAQVISDVREFFENEKKDKKRFDVSRVVDRTAECLKISKSTVKVVTRKVRAGKEFPEGEHRNRNMEVPDEMIGSVRESIMGMYKKKEPVTLDTLLSKLQDKIATRNSGWKWGRTTLYNFLTNRMSYSYKMRKTYHQSLKEDIVVAQQRVKYCNQVQAYRKEGRTIYYQDETWVNKNMTPLKIWLDEHGEGGSALPAGKGQRSIISHVGSEAGFVDQARLIFRGKNALSDSDYHTDMNQEVFQDWMETKVFPNVPAGSVIVIDRASYHTVLTKETKPASSSMTKHEFATWLIEHKIRAKKLKTIDNFLTLKRVELATICKNNKPKAKFEISEMADKHKLKILILPVAHPELNPIEMIWSMMKDYIKKKNVNYSLTDVEKFANEFFETFDNAIWMKCVEHVKKVEQEYLDVADEVPFSM